MSMKSFDKFCERLILAEPNSECEKEVFDERQKQIRLRLGLEAMTVCLMAVLINAMFSEHFVRWSEHQFTAIMLIMVLCLVYWMIRCTASGCWVVVVNKRAQRNSSIMMIFIFSLNLIRYIIDIFEDGIFAADGTLSDEFMFALTFVIGILCGIFSLCVIRRAEKTNESEAVNQNKEETK